MPFLFTSNAVADAPVPVDPTIQLISSAVLIAGDESSAQFVGATQDDVYAWEVLSGPAGAVLSGESTQTATLTWTPDAAGTVMITMQLTDGEGLSAQRTVDLLVIEEESDLLAISEVANQTDEYDLSEGAADWMAFAHTDKDTITQKDGATLISDYARYGNPNYPRLQDNTAVPALTWTDGDAPTTPAAAANKKVQSGRWWNAVTTGSSFNLVTTSTAQTARVFFRLRKNSDAQDGRIVVKAKFAGSSVWEEYPMTIPAVTHTDHCVELVYKSGTKIETEVKIEHVGSDGLIALRAIQVLSAGGGGGPTLTADPETWTVKKGDTITATVTLSGVDDLTDVEITAEGAPPEAEFSVQDGVGTLTYTAPETALSSYTLRLLAERNGQMLASLVKTLTVTAKAEDPPVITLPSGGTITLTQGVAGTVDLSATSNNAAATISLVARDLPGSAVHVSVPGTETVAGTLYWTPISADVTASPHHVTVTATSSSRQSTTATLTINVIAP